MLPLQHSIARKKLPEYFNYLIITTLVIVLALVYLRMAKWLNITDNPGGRSSHTQVTYTGLGVIFPLSLLVTPLLVATSPATGPFFIIGLMILAIISFIDDMIFVKHSVRFVFQLFALVIMVIEMPLGYGVLGLLPIYASAIVFGVGVINAYNFMDGINGMLGLNVLVTLLSFWLLNDILPAQNGLPLHFVDSRMLFAISVAIIVFLFYNFRTKAKSFAGDVGAISIGFIILYLMFLLLLETQNFAYLLLFIVFGIDAGVTVFYKIILRENIFVPHRDFLFKKLVHIAKMKHLRVSAIYALIQLTVSMTTILLFRNIPKSTQIGVLFIGIVGFVWVYIYFRNKFTKKRHEPSIDKKKSLKATYKRIS